MLQVLYEASQICQPSPEGLREIFELIGTVVKIIQIAIPIIIVLLGTIDLGKAVIGGDEKIIKEAQKAFIRRLIYGIAIFFVVMIVRVVFGTLGDRTSGVVGSSAPCWEAVSGN